MKGEILDILGEHINLSTNRPEPLADELTALMCYREVRAFRWGYSAPHEWGKYCELALCKDYPLQTIREAIEKVKAEQK